MKTKFNDEYHSDTTDCQAELPFATVDSFTYKLGTIKELEIVTCNAMQCKMYNITLLDARKHSHGEFHEAGFTLITLDQETKTQNWRANSEDIHLFQEQMEPYLMKMYPQT